MTADPARVVFMGSPEFAVPCLRAVAEAHQVLLVVTQPDRPQGRGQQLAAPAVKQAASELGLPVLQPPTLKDQSVREQLAALKADFFVVVAYGKILSRRILALPRLGCVNVHASLLPRLRGAAPIAWAVLSGYKDSGVSIMLMEEGMDTGPVLLQQPIRLSVDETAGSLHDELASISPPLLLRALEGLRRGALQPQPQDHALATVAPMLRKEDGLIDFQRPAVEVDCRVRGLDPWPGAYTIFDGSPLKVFNSLRAVGQVRAVPGEVLAAERRGLLVACQQDAVWIREIQFPGRKRLPVFAALAGRPVPVGTLLGPRGGE